MEAIDYNNTCLCGFGDHSSGCLENIGIATSPVVSKRSRSESMSVISGSGVAGSKNVGISSVRYWRRRSILSRSRFGLDSVGKSVFCRRRSRMRGNILPDNRRLLMLPRRRRALARTARPSRRRFLVASCSSFEMALGLPVRPASASWRFPTRSSSA